MVGGGGESFLLQSPLERDYFVDVNTDNLGSHSTQLMGFGISFVCHLVHVEKNVTDTL